MTFACQDKIKLSKDLIIFIFSYRECTSYSKRYFIIIYRSVWMLYIYIMHTLIYHSFSEHLILLSFSAHAFPVTKSEGHTKTCFGNVKRRRIAPRN